MDTQEFFTATGSGTPVVLLHASMSSKAQWARLANQCKDSFRMVAVDLQGYGDAPFPEGPGKLSLQGEQEKVEAALNLGIPPDAPFHLVGHGYGGALALRMAAQMKDRVRSLTLIEPHSFHLLGRDEAAYKHVTDLMQGLHIAGNDADAGARHYIDFWNGQGMYDAMPSRLRERMAAAFPKMKLDMQAAVDEPLTLAQCCKIKIPANLVIGSNSPPLSRTIVSLLGMVLPHHTRNQVEGGHMAPITHVEQVNEMLAAFLIASENVALEKLENGRAKRSA